MKKPGNNYAFIDSQNLYRGILESGWKLDYKRFRKYLEEQYGVSKAFLFLGYLRRNKKLYKRLKEDGYAIVFKPILPSRDSLVKGNFQPYLKTLSHNFFTSVI